METWNPITVEELCLDIHTHTLASGHAYGTIREMAAAAAARKLSILGISEHGPGIPGTCDPIYFRNLAVIPRQLSGVNMLFGCEINVLNDGSLSLGQREIDLLDYGIAGIHTLCYKDEGREKNTDNLIQCMKNPKIFFVSHPDDDHTPLNYDRLTSAAKEYHVALELNNSSLLKQQARLNCVANYHTMLALCMEKQVPIIVSSDAHDPSYVGRFNEAVHLLNEIQFDRSLILNEDSDLLLEFIGKNH
ncbi:MAG: phosphatase [Solobacterium sp.]|jgi:putative hydrolase|nr:phosphatase [Solobacterium sp.]MCH4223144.1 phosphatase [Solobacterium sp.]MCH4266543.1 phosphatase [Solobacterium sp.]